MFSVTPCPIPRAQQYQSKLQYSVTGTADVVELDLNKQFFVTRGAEDTDITIIIEQDRHEFRCANKDTASKWISSIEMFSDSVDVTKHDLTSELVLFQSDRHHEKQK